MLLLRLRLKLLLLRLKLLLLQLRLLLLRLGPLSIRTPVPLAKPCGVLRKVLAAHKANLTNLHLASGLLR